MVKVRNLKDIRVLPCWKKIIIVNPDGNPHHEAHVPAFNIYDTLGNVTNISRDYTIDDLKQLRKEIRRVIRNESNK